MISNTIITEHQVEERTKTRRGKRAVGLHNNLSEFDSLWVEL
jgi:hypothetical protein